MAKKMNGLEMLKRAIHPKKHSKHKKSALGLNQASASVQGQQRETNPQQTMQTQTQKFKKRAKKEKKHMKKRKTFGQGPAKNPKGAKPMSDPNLDMKTWKPPVKSNQGGQNTGSKQFIPFTPGARFSKSKKAKYKKNDHDADDQKMKTHKKTMCKSHKVKNCSKCM